MDYIDNFGSRVNGDWSTFDYFEGTVRVSLCRGLSFPSVSILSVIS